jgi:hypothetical protein
MEQERSLSEMAQDLAEAQWILEGKTAVLCERRHLHAMQVYHEDRLIAIAMKLARVHDDVMEME